MTDYCEQCGYDEDAITGLEGCPLCGGAVLSPEPECPVCGNLPSACVYQDRENDLPCGCWCCCICDGLGAAMERTVGHGA